MQQLARIVVNCSVPHPDLYTFNGSVQLEGEPHVLELDLNQFLHRGSMLSNSNSVDALVLYTGSYSKIVLNQG